VSLSWPGKKKQDLSRETPSCHQNSRTMGMVILHVWHEAQSVNVCRTACHEGIDENQSAAIHHNNCETRLHAVPPDSADKNSKNTGMGNFVSTIKQIGWAKRPATRGSRNLKSKMVYAVSRCSRPDSGPNYTNCRCVVVEVQVAEIRSYYLAAHRMHNMRSFFGLFLFKSLLVFEKQPDVSSKCHNTQSQWKGKPNIPQHPSSTTFRNVSA